MGEGQELSNGREEEEKKRVAGRNTQMLHFLSFEHLDLSIHLPTYLHGVTAGG